ncbi:putative MFS monosaccharide transporter [Pseudovirgaria hyperparasitica]|uniref:Putative MFS monosaccharide transporter n=1 Tax=Pseudovirgaria hyperparasitica TaxID=470096 RepID=A0A6A6W5N2_9PEZI|nr:putative MFS monosaccharide transporter [Pseudovirgaria hyperparasitica]KAF2758238.1 putative MFS monosaccharide transporter [Pseudovirgaria hyperparasitica]
MEYDSKTDDNVLAHAGSPDVVLKHEVAPSHTNAAVWDNRQTYGPAGFRGLLSSPYVALCAAFSAIGGLLFGYDQGVVSIILVMPQFLDYVPRISNDASGSGFWKGLLTAMIELGALLGAFNMGWVADKWSRKYGIVSAVVIFTIGSAIQTAAVDYASLIVGRLVGGIGIGMLSMVAPLYISEISPPEIRGTLLVLEELSIVFGIVVAYWITYGTREIAGDWSFRLPFLLQILPGVVLGIGILWLPFSPRWLAMKGRDQEALKSLGTLRQQPESDSRVIQEWYDIRAEATFQKEVSLEHHPLLHATESKTNSIKLEMASFADCFKRGCWRRTMVGMGLMFFQQLVGINALIYYSNSLFELMGQGYETRLILSGVLNVLQLVGVLTSLYTMDKVGRKPLLLIGSVMMCISHLIIAVLVGLFDESWSSHRVEGWVGVAFLFAYMIAFGASWGPVPWAMPSEVFPTSLRAKGVALSTCSNWFFNFIVGLITPPMVQNTGFGAFAFFAVFCFLSFVWTWFFVPETKGRTLEQMDNVFKDVSSEAEEERKKRIEMEIMGSEGIQVTV